MFACFMLSSWTSSLSFSLFFILVSKHIHVLAAFLPRRSLYSDLFLFLPLFSRKISFRSEKPEHLPSLSLSAFLYEHQTERRTSHVYIFLSLPMFSLPLSLSVCVRPSTVRNHQQTALFFSLLSLSTANYLSICNLKQNLYLSSSSAAALAPLDLLATSFLRLCLLLLFSQHLLGHFQRPETNLRMVEIKSLFCSMIHSREESISHLRLCNVVFTFWDRHTRIYIYIPFSLSPSFLTTH